MKPADALLPQGAAHAVQVRGVRGGRPFAATDWVAEEVPIALEYNGISHAVMLATPLDLEDFALGFSLSEGILDSRRELYGVDEEASADGITLKLEVASGAFMRLKERRRTLDGRTGCGLCGTEKLSEVSRPLPPLPASVPTARTAIARAMAESRALQTVQHATGAVHAAAWCRADGAVQLLREDVGRHNALDKLVGAMARAGIDGAQGFVAVTSRASFEMVQKTALAHVPLLAAISAPTAYAIRTADAAGLALVGFARDDDLVVYAHAERVAL
ncbi:MAG: formate dehydrogenase accessory sulfurtransferase FdhD [Proteobacteria bacterium]|nr:formate dehydrogenase accessory sulfurtransferase FdhD [Pseudomonadota bacterium]